MGWDTWGREEGYVLREGAPDSWTLPSSCTTSTFQPTSCGGESKRGTWRTRRWNESLSTKHVESFQPPDDDEVSLFDMPPDLTSGPGNHEKHPASGGDLRTEKGSAHGRENESK